ncbi:hypothetical protein A1O3_00169 [Capronia epimyces CBS 606.96]|uniref:Transcription factor domain-containing protein n=1 Tax=Capronia epimyces CBS 606.96 TaxID=1182542 RepID=W9ZAR9_9EURO|nr:uncharacterized protein A1O3_00169 [Capronia epimyces CBS 606.96]EXJ91619.1 hypothetical protein A1O3_00169 [Capronia epimyces CBS 606.96]
MCPGYAKHTHTPDQHLSEEAEGLRRRQSTAAQAAISHRAPDLHYRQLHQSTPELSLTDLVENDLPATDGEANVLLQGLEAEQSVETAWNSIADFGMAASPAATYSNSVIHYSSGFSASSELSSVPRLVRQADIWGPSLAGTISKASWPSSTDMAQTEPEVRINQGARVPTKIMNDYSSMLVEFYFKEVAALFSCYDSQLNPFRSTVSKLWKSSTSVFYVVQSMAAACLTDVFPNLHAVGAQMRDKAAACIEADIRESKVDAGSLLTLIMLGLSASWHRANDLGQKEFEYARTIMQAIQMGEIPSVLENNNTRNLQFFQEAMIYWEMLLSYVSDITMPLPPSQYQGPALPDTVKPSQALEPSFPHPWTGVAREAQAMVFEVGRLVRQERHRIRNRPFFTSLSDIDTSRKALDTAAALACRLRNLKFPAEEAVVSPGDAQTPVTHLLTIAEVYRLTGLLQLYRVFPDLLATQEEDDEEQSDPHSAWKISEESIYSRLTELALEIVDLLRTIPTESRTRCVQPFLLVASASELRTSPSFEYPGGSGVAGCDSNELSCPVSTSIQVLEARKFVIGRLSTFEHVLPAKPIRQMVEIVKHTWDQLDMGLANVYWMDVMIEKGWETTMG